MQKKDVKKKKLGWLAGQANLRSGKDTARDEQLVSSKSCDAQRMEAIAVL